MGGTGCRIAVVLLLLGMIVSRAGAQASRVVFEDNGEAEHRGEWSTRRLATSPGGGRTFLGPFESGTVRLSLKDLPEHASVRVSFDLLILGSWDGDATQDGAGPDVFALQVGDGRILHFTSFAAGSEVTRHLSLQGFPGLYGVHSTAARTGAIEQDRLGYRYAGMPADAVYRIDSAIPHSAKTLDVHFIASTSSLTADETWGLDNVRVTVDAASVHPLPSAAAMAGAWEQLRSDSPATAMAAAEMLVLADRPGASWIADRIVGQQLPRSMTLDPAHPTLLPTAAGAQGMRVISDPSQRRLELAAHVLQRISTERSRDLLATELRDPPLSGLPPFKLTVSDSASGERIVSLPVRLSNYAGATAVGISDRQGQVTVQLGAGVTGANIGVQIAAEGYIPVAGTWPRSPDGASLPTLDVQLERGVHIGGVVLDDTAAPVANATVLLGFSGNGTAPGALRQQNPYLTAQTDKNGKWSHTNAPRERVAVRVGLYHPHFATHSSGEYTMEPFADIQSLYDATATMRLNRGVPIEGVVVDAGGLPVPHATLSWGQSRFGSNLLPDQNADAEGRFKLAGYPGETIHIAVKSPGFAPEVREIALGGEPIRLRVELAGAKTLTGRVVSRDGSPISGAMVYLSGWRGTNALDMRIFTDSTGRFIWDAAPGDSINASVSRTGYREREAALNPGTDNVVTLDALPTPPAPAANPPAQE